VNVVTTAVAAAPGVVANSAAMSGSSASAMRKVVALAKAAIESAT
jgi:hypothetical protein